MLKWIRQKAIQWLLRIAKKEAAEITVALLAQIDPTTLADKVRPHIRKLFEITGPDWQGTFSMAWSKIDAFVRELFNDPGVGI